MINYTNQTQTEFVLQDLNITTFNINVMDDNNNLKILLIFIALLGF